ncbi:MAG: hypothetical protein A2676_01995 [Candidatus Sungbacteria bacterium RIFCSPHIGHO2_01_FULL_51_22]|uniref:Uncharacterized protein n=1 Tax=Candidatus Sungbacteria bacterium RIFCSPHIGHO2_02_FULL_51_29 TaxID=1802273 RepID=A0A1G2KT95_9BACT|nr:MAG: hypothetical protein A2676_01995 [Candidatus Sungbacteria bacterium RIFCSPHIGHO2_01_FULL_51_22]OHA02626.1 MAG: hypothetical protein A3C16_00230 [Candidatus Sungbacteria bacterium RIFCSPHIGHO2_02_FULL_51_29]OHA04767.1 MAG: hypothetical protein A3B29_01515 [Candidatus Sungbacteria bacterium RIFCSPLOWO2_01_FULL_51_34]
MACSCPAEHGAAFFHGMALRRRMGAAALRTLDKSAMGEYTLISVIHTLTRTLKMRENKGNSMTQGDSHDR